MKYTVEYTGTVLLSKMSVTLPGTLQRVCNIFITIMTVDKEKNKSHLLVQSPWVARTPRMSGAVDGRDFACSGTGGALPPQGPPVLMAS